ncbi:glycosyltransferase family 2 protein [Pseudooceanicola sp. C21-150M6]|uniref:glycosyltransferase family 2 protein n=1 Tax=Pseudooceanicola sp. C21-150M6 TaxID=3434355 RepID=UPI003D7F3102
MTHKIAVVICSVGRPDALTDTLPWVYRQTVPASDVLLVVTKPADLPPADVLEGYPGLQVIYSEKGLPRQRNKGLDAVQSTCDAVFFIDDDYLPARDALAGIGRALDAFPEAAGFTGRLLADGIHTGGVELDEASQLITAYEDSAAGTAADVPVIKRELVGLYGCNMAYRCSMIGEHRFDERLPLYGWQEDVDFAARLPGEKIKVGSLVGVHCGTRSGRETSGKLLGYSQVANAIYLLRKKSLPAGFALKLMARNVMSNHAKLLKPEPWIDRRGRARGNWIAFRDLCVGRLHPERILDLIAGK